MQSTSGHEMGSKGAGKTFIHRMLFRAQSTSVLKEGTKGGREDIYTQSKMNQILLIRTQSTSGLKEGTKRGVRVDNSSQNKLLSFPQQASSWPRLNFLTSCPLGEATI